MPPAVHRLLPLRHVRAGRETVQHRAHETEHRALSRFVRPLEDDRVRVEIERDAAQLAEPVDLDRSNLHAFSLRASPPHP